MAATLLTEGFIDQLNQHIVGLEAQFAQLAQEQQALGKTITDTRSASLTEAEVTELRLMMNKVSLYHTKLLSLHSTMSMLGARSKQLQNRAAKLKESKLQYLAQVDDIRRLEQARDQAIAARVITPIPSSAPIERSSSVASQLSVAGSDRASSSPTAPSPASSSLSISSSTVASPEPIIAMAKKIKRKKPKVREVVLDDSSSPSWLPKRSQIDLQNTPKNIPS
ncbi:uncharacterized protein BYT42DRAFT_588160 [Radiomyces spectabilis]|uniref:uncharacterized protein n=1 Tax=Radiomyces spectabilis TaxID=64574 RepID=UPI00222114AC|nr:uncharacterized protein BYT42DRAFT_588160 [Radiomyces spectabilis]KAI8365908.1 hypothetical protein BYT42DRAFT_588160 [Radiomyces spectabilis]